MTKRFLIVNADDFGLSRGVNRGILAAHKSGIVTSASLLVRAAAALEAVEGARACPELDLGLHLDLGEWKFHRGEWIPIYQVVELENAAAVRDEIARQLDLFRALVGMNPTHLDSHQHVHRAEPVYSLLCAQADELRIPLRDANPRIRYEGRFYGQDGKGKPMCELIEVDALAQLLRELESGITELSCHPGLDDALDSVYAHERILEVKTLCDPREREAVEKAGIELIGFREAVNLL